MKKNNNNTHINIRLIEKKMIKCTSPVGHCRYIIGKKRQNDEEIISFFRLDVFPFRYLLGHRSGV